MTRSRLALLAAAASLKALLLASPALAQGQVPGQVHIFEEAPPLELLRSIMVPESRPGLSRRIVLTNPDRPAPISQPAVVSEAEPEPEARPAPRRPRPVMAPAPEAGPVLASARIAAPAALAAPAAQPAVAPAEAPGTVGFRINFALNSDTVPAAAQPFLARIAELLREEPQVKLQVEGHTDALGSDEYNFLLSQRRAQSVAASLVLHGVAPQRLVVLGKGEGEPLLGNGHDPRNRRVQFLRVE